MKEKIQAIVFRKKRDSFEYLILKRIPKLGGFWQFVSGTCETVDVNNEETLFRELEEEINLIKNNILSVVPDLNSFEFVDMKGNNCHEVVFAVEVSLDFKVDILNNVYEEHSEWKWVDFKEAYDLNEHQHNKDTLKEFDTMLKEIS